MRRARRQGQTGDPKPVVIADEPLQQQQELVSIVLGRVRVAPVHLLKEADGEWRGFAADALARKGGACWRTLLVHATVCNISEPFNCLYSNGLPMYESSIRHQRCCRLAATWRWHHDRGRKQKREAFDHAYPASQHRLGPYLVAS